MPIQLVWDDDAKTILRLDITAPAVTWEEFDAVIDEVVILASSVSHRVGIIVNAGSTPMASGSPIPHIKRAFKVLPANVTVLVNVVTNLFARAIVSAIGPMQFGNKVKVTDSLEKAREIIHKNNVSAGSDSD